VSKVVNHSGFYDKHNCPQRDSIQGPRALLPASDHCDLLISEVYVYVVDTDILVPLFCTFQLFSISFITVSTFPVHLYVALYRREAFLQFLTTV